MNANQTVLYDFINKHPFGAAKTLEALPNEKTAKFLETLSLEKNMKLLKLMDARRAADCLILISTSRSKELLESADISLIATLLKLIDLPVRSKLLTNISSDRISTIKRQLAYLPNSVATLMKTAVVVNKEMTVENALQLFKNNLVKGEFYLYVIDLDGAFKGVVTLKDLFLSEEIKNLEHLMITSIPSILSDISVKNIIQHSGWLEYQEFPVLDTSGRLLGRLLRKDMLKYKSPIKNSNYEIEETGNALGELFRIGFNGLLLGGGK